MHFSTAKNEIDYLLWWMEIRGWGNVTGSEVSKTQNRLFIWVYLVNKSRS